MIMKRIYSFDVFDTLLVRSCGAPSGVFEILAQRILGVDAEESCKCDFVDIRMTGEATARRKKGAADVTLQEIYANCDFSMLTDTTSSIIADMEMAIEAEVLMPVVSMQRKLEKIRATGSQIYFISDMYLQEEFIKELLDKNGFWKEGDKVYVSSKYGVTKYNGELYKLIAKENRLKFSQWHHYGDNRRSDIVSATRLGIRCHLVNHDYNHYEKMMFTNDGSPDFGVGMQLAGVSRALRLSSPVEDMHTSFTTSIIAPLYTSFVYDALCNARKNGITLLFFFARDGYLPFRIAQEFATLFPEIKMKYIYTSRSALYLPGVRDFSPESLKTLLMAEFNQTTIAQMLSHVMSPEAHREICAAYPELATLNCSKESFVKMLEHKEAARILKEYVTTQRHHIIQYFRQNGLTKESNAAFLDLRGTRSSQGFLNNILEAEGYNKMKGYYFDVMENKIITREIGKYFAFIDDRRCMRSSILKNIPGFSLTFEIYFSITSEKRTLYYEEADGKIIPVFKMKEENDINKAIAVHRANVVTLYARRLIQQGVYRYNKTVKELSMLMLADIVNSPQREFLKALYNVNPRVVNILTLNNLRRHDFVWLRGSVAYTLRCKNPLFLDIVRKIMLRFLFRIADRFNTKV